MSSMQILNIRLDIISKKQVLNEIQNLINSNKTGKQLITLNPEFILAAQKNSEFKNIINNSWLITADGFGLRLAAKFIDLTKKSKNKVLNFLTGMRIAWWGINRKSHKLDIISENITGVDLMHDIGNIIPNAKIFLLGGWDNTPQITATNLKKKFNNLTIYSSAFEKENIIEQINNSQTEILFVALNHPRAQIWINENLKNLPNIKLAVGVGGAFDYISGKIKRAPQNWQGFEWLYRLFHQPKRFKRIFNAWIVFSWKVFTNSLK